MKIDFVRPPMVRRRTAVKEVSTVRLNVDRQVGAVKLPAGSQGAVVFVYRGGKAYEVEFVEPIAAVLTVPAAELTQ